MGGDYDGDLYLLIGDCDIVTPLCAAQGVPFTEYRKAKTRSDNPVKIKLNECVKNDDVIHSKRNVPYVPISEKNVPCVPIDSIKSEEKNEKEISFKFDNLCRNPKSTSTSTSTFAPTPTPLPLEIALERSPDTFLGTAEELSKEYSSPKKEVFHFDFNFATCSSPIPDRGPPQSLKIPETIPLLTQVLPNIITLSLSEITVKNNDDCENNDKDEAKNNYNCNNNNPNSYANEFIHDNNQSNNNCNNNCNNNNVINPVICASPALTSSHLHRPQGISSRALTLLSTPPSLLSQKDFNEVRKRKMKRCLILLFIPFHYQYWIILTSADLVYNCFLVISI